MITLLKTARFFIPFTRAMRLAPLGVVTGFILSASAAHADIRWSPMVTNGDGTVRVTPDYHEAEKYCANQKMRLPTKREWAERSRTMGARGILETRFPGVSRNSAVVVEEVKRMGAEGYHPVYRLDSNKIDSKKQVVVDFYFNPTGYNDSREVIGNFWHWCQPFLDLKQTDITTYLDVRRFFTRGDLYYNPRDAWFISESVGGFAVTCVEEQR